MFSMCSELTPRASIPETRIPQLMQPWVWYFKVCVFNEELFFCDKNMFCEILIFCVEFDITKRAFLDKSVVAKTRTGNALTSSHLWAIEPCWTIWTEENDKSLRNHCKLLDKWIVVKSAGKIINTSGNVIHFAERFLARKSWPFNQQTAW